MGGHSAGAYLSFMVGLDTRYLAKHGMDPKVLAGLLPVSGQTMTHFTVRADRGQDKNKIIADDAAPIFHVRKETPPMLVMLGDHDWPARAEENAYFVAAMKVAGNAGVSYRQFADRTHGTIGSKFLEAGTPDQEAVREFFQSCIKARTTAR